LCSGSLAPLASGTVSAYYFLPEEKALDESIDRIGVPALLKSVYDLSHA